jgi:hypothetical protein
MRAAARLLLPALLCLSVASADPPPPKSLKDQLPRLRPTEPADAAKSFRVLDGFAM